MNKNDKDKNPSIKFREKKTKNNIRIGAKALYIILLAGISGAVISNFFIEHKYNNIVKNNLSSKINEDMVILDYTKVAEKVLQSLVAIASDVNKLDENISYIPDATGVVLDESGIILTTYSAIKDVDSIYVKLPHAGMKPIKGEFIGGDPNIDVALIKINTNTKLEVVKLAKIDETRVGQEIAIISNPTGDGYIGSVIPGIVTSTFNTYGEKNYKLMQVSAPINSFNDGGAICNSKGELLGIASFKITDEIKEDQMYYGIDLRELEDIISTATTFKDALGLVGGSILRDKDSDLSGFYVQGVKKGGLADNAGISPTDIIISIDGCNITDSHDIQQIIKDKKSGDEIKLDVINDGILREINIELQ